MASKQTKTNVILFKEKSKTKIGRHAKSKTTFNKGNKNYIKSYKGQGR
jgi:hypothetical protein